LYKNIKKILYQPSLTLSRSLSLSLAFSFALTADLKSYTKINRRQIEFHPLQQKNNKICFLNWL